MSLKQEHILKGDKLVFDTSLPNTSHFLNICFSNYDHSKFVFEVLFIYTSQHFSKYTHEFWVAVKVIAAPYNYTDHNVNIPLDVLKYLETKEKVPKKTKYLF